MHPRPSVKAGFNPTLYALRGVLIELARVLERDWVDSEQVAPLFDEPYVGPHGAVGLAEVRNALCVHFPVHLVHEDWAGRGHAWKTKGHHQLALG